MASKPRDHLHTSGRCGNASLRLLTITVLIVFFHVFMEWLFFATKTSFLSDLGIGAMFQVLLASAAPLLLAGGCSVGFVLALGGLLRGGPVARSVRRLACLIPSLALAAALLVLVDNFTITVLGFGIRDAGSVLRWVHLALALVLAALSYHFVSAHVAAPRRSFIDCSATSMAAGLVVLSLSSVLAFGLQALPTRVETAGSGGVHPEGPRARPNILLLASDGLDATHMSAYGYARDTTPTIAAMLPQALVAENAFANSSQTGASIASLLTGKLPTETHLIFPPDVLRGRDSSQHLPGILARHGYRNVQVSIRNYADAYDLNMRGAFDWANGRGWEEYQLPAWAPRLLGDAAYFLERMADRLQSRLLHIAGVRSMPNPLAQIEGALQRQQALERGFGKAVYQDDLLRLQLLFDFIDESPEPFFAHVQLFGTHGPGFANARRVFSAGQDQDQIWMQDFYDDAVLQFDDHLARILVFLQSRGRLEDTVVIVHSDHGQRWQTGRRIPLLFSFPGGEHAGRIRANVQNTDIAPTLLDHLGIPIPDWMHGHSLLESEPERKRAIFIPRMYVSDEIPRYRASEGNAYPHKRETPFRGIEVVAVVVCNRSYRLHLATNQLESSEVPQHTAPCAESELPSPQQVRKLIVQHLETNGYDTSSLVR